jgi:hypothetical protein
MLHCQKYIHHKQKAQSPEEKSLYAPKTNAINYARIFIYWKE